MRLERTKSQLLIVDMQEKVLPHVRKAERVLDMCLRLIRIARRLEVPITIAEHYPQGLGPTVSAVLEAAPQATRMEKVHFSCLGDDRFREHLRDLRRHGRSQVVAAGIESQVCLGLTVLGLQANGFDAFVAADAVSGRSKMRHRLALARMRQAGAQIVDSESVLFEWLDRADTPEFRELIALIK